MSMYQAIKETTKQFAFKPEIENKDGLSETSKYLLVGMGGSGLAGRLLQMINPDLDLVIHNGYGLSSLPDLKERLIILSSYSGNTEEVLDAYQQAGELGLNRTVVSIGGSLLEQAKKDKVAYVEMPDFNIQPRSALVLSLMSLFKLTGSGAMLSEMNRLASTFQPEDMEAEGKALAERIKDYVPVVYASDKNKALAYIWKVVFNETGKIPAFYNIVPELNHTEISGFDPNDSTRSLSGKLLFIFLEDETDHARIKKRMEVTAKLYTDRGLRVESVELSGDGILLKALNSLMLVYFAAYFVAENYGLDPNQVSLIEEFKKLINE